MRFFVAITIALIAPVTTVRAEAPTAVPVVAAVSRDGRPLDGAVRAAFRIYRDAAGGAPIFEEEQQVAVVRGVLRAYVGDGLDLDLVLFRDEGVAYLAVSIDGEPELVPRLPIATTPFAGYATHGADASALGGVASSAWARSGHGAPWSDVTGRPAGWDDGDQTGAFTPTGDVAISRPEISIERAAVRAVADPATVGDVAAVTAAVGDRYLARASAFPSGAVIFLEGACPAGFDDVGTLAGRTPVGVVAGGTVGGTVGPAMADLAGVAHGHAVVAPSEVMSAVAGEHAHDLDAAPTATSSYAHGHEWSYWNIDARCGGGGIGSNFPGGTWTSFNSAGTRVTTTNWNDGMDTDGSGDYPLSRACDDGDVRLYTARQAHAHSVDPPPVTTSAQGAHSHDVPALGGAAQPTDTTLPYVQLHACRRR